jgi:beta-lactamase regulating signal transducer with metallopeptidase domain
MPTIDTAALSGALLGAFLKSSALFVLASGLAAALRRASASLRHLVWVLALGAALALPALSQTLPAWRLEALAPVFRAVATPDPGGAPTEAAEPIAGGPRSLPGLDSRGGDAAAAEPAALVDSSGAGREGAAGDGLRGRLAALAGVPWTVWLVGAWLAGCALVCGAIGLGLLRTWTLARRGRRVAGGELGRALEEAAAALGVSRRMVLMQGDERGMPMTWGALAPRILLPAEAGSWSRGRLSAVLLHEVAHVKRFDYLTQILARCSCALYWFNPLAWLAARRLRIEREHACDDEVLRAGSRPSDYAGHLLEMARSLKAGPAASIAAVALARARPSQVAGRLQAVLDPGRPRTRLTARRVLLTLLGAACLALPIAAAAPADASFAAPGVAGLAEPPLASAAASTGEAKVVLHEPRPAASAAGATEQSTVAPQERRAALCDWYAADGESSTSIQSEDDEWRIRLKRERCELRVESSGEVEFNDDETDVAGLAPGGSLEIEERVGRAGRRLEVRAGQGGALERRWWVDGDEQPYDAAARAWLSEMILVIYRCAGYQAEERAARILAREGAAGLLRELEQVRGDYAAGLYYKVLLRDGDLGPQELESALRQAGARLESDYQLAELLIAALDNQRLDEAGLRACLDAARSIESDYELGRVLGAVLEREPRSEQLWTAWLQAIGSIESDYERAELLTRFARGHPLDAQTTPDFLGAALSISSDYEMGRVLAAALASDQLPRASLAQVLEAAASIESDYELANVLAEVAQERPLDNATRTAFFRAVEGISSDFERRRVLSAVVRAEPFTVENAEAVLAAALAIDSDYELAELLVQLAGRRAIDQRLRPAFQRALDSIESRYERERAQAAAAGAAGVEPAGAGADGAVRSFYR